MQTKVDIVNLALGNLSDTNFIESLDEDNPEATQMSLRWDNVCDIVLSEFAWSFALRRASLALLASSPEEERHYSYPADCVKIRRLVPSVAAGHKLPFRIGRSVDNRYKVIITTVHPVTAEYTTRDIPVAEWPAGFTNAFAWRLAAGIALASRADPQLANAMLQSYAYQIGQAKLFDAEERGDTPLPESEWIRSRDV